MLLRELSRTVQQARESGCILDAALIPHWGIESWFDVLCWVESPFEQRLARLKARSSLAEEEIRKRMCMQQELFSEPSGNAWVRIPNEGTPEELERFLESPALAAAREVLRGRGGTPV